jgi:hypothetical protein
VDGRMMVMTAVMPAGGDGAGYLMPRCCRYGTPSVTLYFFYQSLFSFIECEKW